MIDDFMALSRVLTGVEDLDVNLGRHYSDRLASSPFQPQLDEILERFRAFKKGDKLVEQVKAKIVEVDRLRPDRMPDHFALVHLNGSGQLGHGAPGVFTEFPLRYARRILQRAGLEDHWRTSAGSLRRIFWPLAIPA